MALRDIFWWTCAVGLSSFAVVSQRNIQTELLMIGNQPVEYDETTIDLQMSNLSVIIRKQQMWFFFSQVSAGTISQVSTMVRLDVVP